MAAYLVRVRGAHKDDGTLLWYLPTTPRMHFTEEKLNQNRECPQKGIVDIFVHNGKLFAPGISFLGRHDGGLDQFDAAAQGEESDEPRRSEGEVSSVRPPMAGNV